MTRRTEQNAKKRGGRLIPALCNVSGTVIIVLVILLMLPLTVPRLLGYEIYHVVSGSMAPAIPRGSLVLVRPESAREIREGDVIAYESGGTVVTHRVAEIREAEGEFVTKGDANEEEDFLPVSFAALIGRVERSVPILGAVSALATDTSGKLRLLGLLAGGVLLRLLGSRLKGASYKET